MRSACRIFEDIFPLMNALEGRIAVGRQLQQKYKNGNFTMKLKNPLRSLLLSGLLTMLAVWSVLAGPTQADELRIATSHKLMTLDPLYANLNENTSLLSHIYERLVYQDEHLT